MASEDVYRRYVLLLRQQLGHAHHFGRPRASTLRTPALDRSITASSTLRSSPAPETHKTHSPAPIIPPKADPPSKNLKPDPPPPKVTTAIKVAQEVRKLAGGVTETYIAYSSTKNLYRECAAQANYSVPQAREKGVEIPKTSTGVDQGVGEGWWYRGLNLTPTFNTWAQITMLHIYLFSVRIRSFPVAHSPAWQQHLLDHFFFDAEQRMIENHRMNTRTARNRYLKDLFIQYRGAMAAYDEGLCRGDAVLATALWRNIFAADEDLDFTGLACVVGHVRRTVSALEMIPDEDIAAGMVRFADPAKDESLVRVRSGYMDRPFETAGK